MDATYRAARFDALRGMINRSADPTKVTARVTRDYELNQDQAIRLFNVLQAVREAIEADCG